MARRDASVLQQIDYSLQHCPYLSQSIDSVTGALGQIEFVMRPEQSVHEALDFLFPHQRVMVNAISGLLDLHLRQLKGFAGGLVDRETIPKTVHQNMKQLIQVVHAAKQWKLAA